MGEVAHKHLKGTEWNIKMFTINGGRKEEQLVIHSLNNKAAFSDYSPSFITLRDHMFFFFWEQRMAFYLAACKTNSHLHMPDLVN